MSSYKTVLFAVVAWLVGSATALAGPPWAEQGPGPIANGGAEGMSDGTFSEPGRRRGKCDCSRSDLNLGARVVDPHRLLPRWWRDWHDGRQQRHWQCLCPRPGHRCRPLPLMCRRRRPRCSRDQLTRREVMTNVRQLLSRLAAIFSWCATILSLAVLLSLVVRPALAAGITIDFENLPSLSAQPNNFFAAGAEQTYNDPGVFSISGGVVLGNPTFLASFPTQGSPPNLYGTADFADPSLLDTITLTFPIAENVTSFAAVLFNGQSTTETYQATASSGATTVASQTVTNLAAASDPAGFAHISLASSGAAITAVILTTPNAGINGWDFLVDTITITSTPTSVVPLPAALPLFATGLGALGLLGWRRKRKLAA